MRCFFDCLLITIIATVITDTVVQHSESSVLKDERFLYKNAIFEHKATRKPLIVVVGAKWCAPCRAYKADTIKKLATKILDGGKDYHLAIVDYDDDKKLSSSIFDGQKFSLPFTAIYYNDKNGGFHKKCFYGKATLPFIELLLKNIKEK